MTSIQRTTLVLMLVLAGAVAFHAAGPPETLNYQGVLRDAANAPLDGTYDMTFRFFDADAAGTELLSDEHLAAGAGGVVVSGGMFNVALGSGALVQQTPGYTSLMEVFQNHQHVWLEVVVGGETLTPRIKVAAAAYALNAGTVGGRDASQLLDTSGSSQTKTGNLTVGSLTLAGSNLDLGTGGEITASTAHTWLRNSDDTDDLRLYAGNDVSDGAIEINGNSTTTLTSGNGNFTFRDGSDDTSLATLSSYGTLSLTGSLVLPNGSLLYDTPFVTVLNGGSGDDQILRLSANGNYNQGSVTIDANGDIDMRAGDGNFFFRHGIYEVGALEADGDLRIDGDMDVGGGDLEFFNTGHLHAVSQGFKFIYDSSPPRQLAHIDHTGKLDLYGQLVLGSGSSGDNDGITFDGVETLIWDNAQSRFEISDALQVANQLIVGTSGVYSYNSIAGSTPISGDVSSTSDLMIGADLEVASQIYAADIRSRDRSAGGGEHVLRLSSAGTLAFMMDDENNSGSLDQFEWYQNGSYSNGTQLAELQSNGDLEIRGLFRAGTTTFDLAERFLASEPLEPGDVVRIDPDRSDAVLKSTGDDGRGVIGVVSTAPAMVLGGALFGAADLGGWGSEIEAEFRAERDRWLTAAMADEPALAVLREERETLRGALRAFDEAEAAGSVQPDGGGEDAGSPADLMEEAAVGDGADTEASAPVEILESERDRARERLDRVEQLLERAAVERFAADRFVAVALSGRVPVKVDAGMHPIEPGDALIAGPIPGVAVKATRAGRLIGTALERLSAGTGTVLTLVQGGAHAPVDELQASHAELTAAVDERTPDPVSGVQSVAGNLQVVLDQSADQQSRFSIFKNGSDRAELGSEVFRVDEEGNVYARGSFRPSAMDVAEYFRVGEPVEAGDVLAVDLDDPKRYRRVTTAGDPAVVGIVSEEPGVMLGAGMRAIAASNPALVEELDEARRLGDVDEEARVWRRLESEFRISHAPVAMTGTVPCKVDAGYGEIRPGDLLMSSPTPGHAMRADGEARGTIIGKALEPLATGTGTVRVLVMLR